MISFLARLFHRKPQPLRHVIATKAESKALARKYADKHEQLARELGMQNPVARNG